MPKFQIKKLNLRDSVLRHHKRQNLLKRKKEGKDQKSIRVPHLTQDTTWKETNTK